MLQNKYLFNQSSVSLEIIGLPDYSNNEGKDNISIISQWKLMIVDKPVIEGNLDHLKAIMKAFYTYSTSLLSDEFIMYKSNLIDINRQNYYLHNLLLKSTKLDVEPLNISIGNSVLADIINCFDQLSYSNKVKNIFSNEYKSFKNKSHFNLFSKERFSNLLLPPLISLGTIFLFSTAFINLYYGLSDKENSLFLNTRNKLISIKSTNKLL